MVALLHISRRMLPKSSKQGAHNALTQQLRCMLLQYPNSQIVHQLDTKGERHR